MLPVTRLLLLICLVLHAGSAAGFGGMRAMAGGCPTVVVAETCEAPAPQRRDAAPARSDCSSPILLPALLSLSPTVRPALVEPGFTPLTVSCAQSRIVLPWRPPRA